MVEKRARKFASVADDIRPPELEGPPDADVTLIGWGSSYGVISEAVAQLESKGIVANHLPIKWMVPFHAEAVSDVLSRAKRTIIVENNYSGQFHRYLRSVTGLDVEHTTSVGYNDDLGLLFLAGKQSRGHLNS